MVDALGALAAKRQALRAIPKQRLRLYAGVAATRAEAWPVLLLPLLLLYIDRVVIPAEEARLRQAFGDAYGRYGARVRRWL